MSVVVVSPARAGEEPRARAQRFLRRYPTGVRPRIEALAARHPRLAQLAESFPGLLFALVMPRRGVDPSRAIAGVIEGAALSETAKAAGIPTWLRKLRAEMFTAPLPHLPDGELFRRQIVNHLPRSPKLARRWLTLVAEAACWGHEALAVWVARELMRDPKAVDDERLIMLGLWAFFSQRPDTFAHRFVASSWHPAMRFKTAVHAAEAWRTRVSLYVNLGEGSLDDMWLKSGHASGYDFLPLASADDLSAESDGMRNCVDTYGYRLLHDRARLWSVRSNGARVATLRVEPRYGPYLSIVELRAPQNAQASDDVWWAAHAWLNSQDIRGVDAKQKEWSTAPLDRAAWQRVWRPYWLAKRRIPEWLPLTPTHRLVATL